MSQLRHLFVRCSYFFYNVSITLYFGTSELLMEITLQLRFDFACYCDVFFITSQLRDLVMFFDDVRILRFILLHSKYLWK